MPSAAWNSSRCCGAVLSALALGGGTSCASQQVESNPPAVATPAPKAAPRSVAQNVASLAAEPQAPPAHFAVGDELMKHLPTPSPDAAALAPRLRCEQRQELWGCLGPDGAVAIPFEFAQLGRFSKAGIASAFHPDKGFWYMDATGRYLYQPYLFDNGFDPLIDERSRFVFRGKPGYIDREFRVVIPPRYDAAWYFQDGSALVCVDCDPRLWSKDAPERLEQGRAFFVDLGAPAPLTHIPASR